MHRILASAAVLAASAPLALIGMGSANASAPHHSHIDGHEDGFNLIFGSRFDDTLFGTHDADAIFGRNGNDRLISNGGADRLSGNRGDDTLIDNQPSFFGNVVQLRGGSGFDVCIGNTNDQFINCETVIVL